MQDTFARATHSAGQARRATIGYLVYKVSELTRGRHSPPSMASYQIYCRSLYNLSHSGYETESDIIECILGAGSESLHHLGA